MNHYPPRVMGAPQGGPAQRLNELLESIKTEFEAESQRSVDYEGQSEFLPCHKSDTVEAPCFAHGAHAEANMCPCFPSPRARQLSSPC